MQEEYVYFGNCVGLINSKISKKGILFNSGFFGDKDESHGLFRDYIPLLHKQGFSTLRFDATGLGESNKDLENVTIKTWIEDSYEALNYFHISGIEQIGIVGFSLGATHAILNYSQNPEITFNIKGLALWAPAFDPQRDMLYRYKQNGDYEKSQRKTLFKSGKAVSTAVLDSLDFDVFFELENIDCPILICHSKQDSYIPLNTSEFSKKRIQHLDQLFILNNSGHSFRSSDNLSRSIVYDRTSDFFQKYLK